MSTTRISLLTTSATTSATTSPTPSPTPARTSWRTSGLAAACAAALAAPMAFGLGAAQAQTAAGNPTSAMTAATTGASANATGTNRAAGATGAAANASRRDRGFVTDAAASGMAEVMLGKLAQAQGASPEVKQYGAQMVADHTKANEELMALAQARNIAPPAQPTAAQQRMHDNMAKLQGNAFDRLYMATMVKDHTKAVSLFEKQSKSGDDAELKAFAQKTLPTLQEHLKMTQALAQSVDKKIGR